jgi:MFS family permease
MSVPLRSAAGRGALTASILGSGMAFLDGTAVNVALPSIGKALHADLAGLQWTVDAYLLTLTAFLLIGGSLGDRLGRARVFSAGVVGSCWPRCCAAWRRRLSP